MTSAGPIKLNDLWVQMNHSVTDQQLHLSADTGPSSDLNARLMIAQLKISEDKEQIFADAVAQSILGGPQFQPLTRWLTNLEPIEIHNLIGKIEIDSASVLIRDRAGAFAPARLWQYQSDESTEWQIAIQIETQNAIEDNPFEKRFFAQQQLLSIISHELRTPAATLKMLIDDLSKANIDEQLPLLRQTGEHLMAVLQDMRQAINPEQNLPRQIRAFHPNRLLESVSSQVRRLAQAQGISLKMKLLSDEQIRVESDLERCKLIAVNLLKNAVIHSEGSEVQICATLVQGSGGDYRMHLKIVDNGIGIEPSQIQRMLQPFERLEGLEQGGDGAGLGLFVVKQSVDELKGDLRLLAAPGGGLLAEVAVPVRWIEHSSNELADPHQESQLFQERLSKMRVLVVEDDPVIRMVSQKLLAKRVAHVDVAENGAVGLERIKRERYDLILSDYFMPVMDGAEMIRQMRSAGISTPIISVTAAVLGEEAQELRDAGANMILAKPISMKAFIESVEQL